MRKLLENLKTSTLCFFSGDIFSTGFYLLYGGNVTHFMLQAFSTIVMGVLGGLAALAGKDLYPVLKKRIKGEMIRLKTKFTKHKNEKTS